MSFYEPYFSQTILLCCTFRISMMLCGLRFKQSDINVVFFALEQFASLLRSSVSPGDLKRPILKFFPSSLCCEMAIKFMLLILDFITDVFWILYVNGNPLKAINSNRVQFMLFWSSWKWLQCRARSLTRLNCCLSSRCFKTISVT